MFDSSDVVHTELSNNVVSAVAECTAMTVQTTLFEFCECLFSLKPWTWSVLIAFFDCSWSLLNHGVAQRMRLNLGNLNPIYERELIKLGVYHEVEGS